MCRVNDRHVGALRARERVVFSSVLGVLTVLLAAPPAAGRQASAVVIDDLFEIQDISDPRFHPEGGRIAFVVSRMDADSNRYRRSVWMADVESGDVRRLTFGAENDHSPRWSPDGQWLAFISSRSGSPQLWVMATAGGDAKQLTSLGAPVSDPEWSPDSRQLVVVSSVEELPTPAAQLMGAAVKSSAGDVRVLDRLRYRAGTQYFDGRYPHLFIVSLEGGQPRQLTHGAYEDSEPAWSPDGGRIAFVSNRTDEPDLNRNTDIWVVAVEGASAQRLAGAPGTDAEPRWSPDGKWLAFRGNVDEHDYGSQYQAWVVSSDGGPARSLTGELDRPPAGLEWGPDGRIYATIMDHGNVQLHSFDLAGGRRTVITGRGQVADVAAGARGHLVYLWTTPTRPAELRVVESGSTTTDLDGSTGRALTSFNEAWRSARTLIEPEELRFRGADGWEIQGWVMKPATFGPGQRFPLILEIHGGPYGMYGNQFDLEFQLMAAQGWGVLFTNPRGSTGYGQKFEHAVTGDLVGKAFEDLMHGVDAALARHDWADATRLGVAGGSYGGLMTNWVIGHTTRFAAAVTQRSITNWISFYGTADIPSWVELELGAAPWEKPLELWRSSPMAYVDRITTPTLIIHSELDFRVPVSQAEELHRALVRRGVPTLFVRFPDEGHDLTRSGQPLHRKENLEWIVRWFMKYLGDRIPRTSPGEE
jgi:dipeptidyl aminopeptidase/acylaminoacyl peptidase